MAGDTMTRRCDIRVNHFYLMQLAGSTTTITAIDLRVQVIDRFETTRR